MTGAGRFGTNATSPTPDVRGKKGTIRWSLAGALLVFTFNCILGGLLESASGKVASVVRSSDLERQFPRKASSTAGHSDGGFLRVSSNTAAAMGYGAGCDDLNPW